MKDIKLLKALEAIWSAGYNFGSDGNNDDDGGAKEETIQSALALMRQPDKNCIEQNGKKYQAFEIPNFSLESPVYRAAVQLLVGIEQGHPDQNIRQYAGSFRNEIKNNPSKIFTQENCK